MAYTRFKWTWFKPKPQGNDSGQGQAHRPTILSGIVQEVVLTSKGVSHAGFKAWPFKNSITHPSLRDVC